MELSKADVAKIEEAINSEDARCEAHFAEEYHARLNGLMYSGELPPYHGALHRVDNAIRPLLEQIAEEE